MPEKVPSKPTSTPLRIPLPKQVEKTFKDKSKYDRKRDKRVDDMYPELTTYLKTSNTLSEMSRDLYYQGHTKIAKHMSKLSRAVDNLSS